MVTARMGSVGSSGSNGEDTKSNDGEYPDGGSRERLEVDTKNQEGIKKKKVKLEELTEVEELLRWRRDELWELKEETIDIWPWEVRGPGGAEYDRWHKLKIKFAVKLSQEAHGVRHSQGAERGSSA